MASAWLGRPLRIGVPASTAELDGALGYPQAWQAALQRLASLTPQGPQGDAADPPAWAGEGLEIAIATDHNFVSDWRPTVAAQGLEPWIASFPGIEFTTLESGHFNSYPLDYKIVPVTPAPDTNANGIPDSCERCPADLSGGSGRDRGTIGGQPDYAPPGSNPRMELPSNTINRRDGVSPVPAGPTLRITLTLYTTEGGSWVHINDRFVDGITTIAYDEGFISLTAVPVPEPRSLALLLACLGMLGPFAIDTYLPAFSGIAASLNATPLQMQQTLSAYLLGFAAMNLFHGALSDSVGRRPVVLAGVALFTAASLGCALSESIGALVAFRALQGLSAGAGMVVSRALIRDLYAPADAQRMMSQVSLFFGVAPAVAPLFGGLLFAWLGWHAIFWMLALLGAALWGATARWLPETLPPAQRQPLKVGNLLRGYVQLLRNPRFMALVFASGHATNVTAISALCERQDIPATRIYTLDELPAHPHLKAVGLFQQRPSQGWGTVEQIMNPEYSSNAFYDALETNDSAVKVLGDKVLKQIARELTDTIRRSVTIDWTVKETVRAKLRTLVRRKLRQHGYPPDMTEKAVETVLKQAETLAAGWAT